MIFYREVMDYFFDNDNLHFRALIVPDKSKLRLEEFLQSHDDWYYKMYFDMLKVILGPKSIYRIYLDIKDTRSANKIAKLHDVLCNNLYDFSRKIIERVQAVRSHEVEILQLADRKNYVLPWTAYIVDKPHRRQKLQKECNYSAKLTENVFSEM